MTTKIFLRLFFFLGVFSTVGFALPRPGGLSLNVEPVVGYERTQKVVPTPHTTDRLVYGVRVTAGFPLLSAEAEYLRATDTEEFPTQSLQTVDTADKGKLGVRSTFGLAALLSFHLRAGAQATLNTHEETRSGVKSTVKDPIRYNPYAGAGGRVWLGTNFALTADLTVVFQDFPTMAKNEYQATAGFRVSFP